MVLIKIRKILMKIYQLTLILCLSVFTPSVLQALEGSSEKSTEVVFMQSSMVGKFNKSSIYEVTENGTKFIGILANKKKITYQTTAGKHTFMVVSEAADFMEADLLEGKTYYSIITPRMGAWKTRFSMWPIQNGGNSKYQIDSKDFEKWMKKAKDHTPGEKDQKWYQKHQENIEKKRLKYWPVWQQKSVDDLALRTLKPEDGL